MPQPGEIFLYKDYEFSDGTKADKLFVVLNASDLEKPCLVLKTTSQLKRYQGCVKGCNKALKCFFTPAVWQTCFNVDTYIQLPQIFEFPSDRLIRAGITGAISFIPPLTSDCLSQLKSCLAGYKDDISIAHWGLIYKAKP